MDNIAGLGQRWAAKATVGATDGGVNALTSGIYANQRYGDPLNPKAVVGGFLSGGLTANPGRGPQADGGHGGEGGETGRPGSRPAANGDGGGRSAGTRSGTTPTPGGPRPDSATPPSGTGGASRSAGESSGTQPGTSNSVRPESDSSTGRSATASESSASGADSGVRAETRTSPVPLADTTSHQPLVETPTSASHTETVPVETPHQTGENPTDAPQSGSGVQGVHGSQPGESSPPTSGAPTPGPPTSHVSEASGGPAAESIPPSTSDSGQARSVPAATTTASADTSTPASQSAAPPTGTSSTTHAPTHGRVDAPTAESSAPNRDSPGGRADPPAPRTESVPTRQDAAPARQEAAPVRQDSAPARQDSGPARHESSTDRPHVKGDNLAAPRSERPAPHSSGPRHAAPDQHRTGDGAGESRLPLDQPSHDTSAPDRPKADQPSGAEQRGDTDGHPAQDLPRENDSTPRSDTRDAEGGREISSEDRRDAATGPVDRAVSETLSSAEHDESSSVQHRSEETVCSDADWSAADVAAALALPTSHGVVSEGAQTHQPRTQGLSGSTGGGRRENGDTASRSAPHRAPEYEGGGGEGSRAGGDDGSGRPPVDADGASSASAPRPDVPADLYRAAEARGFQRNEIHDLLHRLAEAGALDHQGNRVLEGAGREHLDRLSSHEIDALLALRDSNPLPDLTHDPIRKVVSGRQLDAIFDQARDGTEFAPGRDPAGVGGCVSATVDVDSRMRTPLEIDEGLRLDYDGSPFNRLGPHDPVYVIDGHVELGEGGAINRLDRDLLDEASRRDPQMTFDDPHSSRLAAGDPPHTGVGYPGSDRVLTPEYEISGDARYVDGAEVKRINPDGSSDVMARLIDGEWHAVAPRSELDPGVTGSTGADHSGAGHGQPDHAAGDHPATDDLVAAHSATDQPAGDRVGENQADGDLLPREHPESITAADYFDAHDLSADTRPDPGQTCFPDALDRLSDLYGRDMDRLSDVPIGPEGITGREAEYRAGGELRVTDHSALEERLNQIGPRSSAVVVVEHSPWSPHPGFDPAAPRPVGAHAYTAVNDGGVVRYFDGPANGGHEVSAHAVFGSGHRTWATTFDTSGRPVHELDSKVPDGRASLDEERRAGERGPSSRIGGHPADEGSVRSGPNGWKQ